jgi:hypothetical protein
MSNAIPNDPLVTRLETTLFWPISLHAQGSLYKDWRANKDRSPAEWLGEYANFIAINSMPQGGWKRVEDPLSNDGTDYFGINGLYGQRQLFAEFAYFHPFIEKILYEKDPNRRVMEVLVRTDLQGLEVILSRQTEKDTAIGLEVRRVQMFLFTTDMAILTVHLGLDTTVQKVGVNQALHLLNEVRRVYAPYFTGTNGPPGQAPLFARWIRSDGFRVETPNGPLGDLTDRKKFGSSDWDPKVAESLNQRRLPLYDHWRDLINPLIPWQSTKAGKGEHGETIRCQRPDGLCFEQLGDERAHSHVYLAVDKPTGLYPETLFRLGFLDEGDSGWAYQPEFLQTKADDLFYDRFWHSGTRYMVSSFSFVMLTGTKAPDYLYTHYRHHYFQLNLLAVLQKSSLLIFWDRLSNLLRDYSFQTGSRPQFHRDQSWLAEDYAHFLALFDFSEVSNQLQPLELFDKMRKQMRIPQLLNEVSQQLRYTFDIERSNHDEEIQLTAQRWIPVALALSFLGISGLEKILDLIFKVTTKFPSQAWFQLLVAVVGVTAVVLFFIVLFALLFRVRWVKGVLEWLTTRSR